MNSRDCYNHTPLMEAAGFNENLEVLKYLVERGSVVDACDKGGCTALFYAASRKNSVSAIRFLVSKGAHHSELGYTALHFAAFQGNVEAVKELLALGASPEFLKVDSLKCDYVPPPLLLAAARRQREVVDAFLEHPECMTELRIDALLLLGCGKHVDQYEWKEALTFREKCLAAMQFLPPSEAFGGRTEMRTVAYLNAVMTSEADMQYQSWIIRERCIGKLEPNEVIDNSCGGNSVVNAFDKHGRRPLHVAAQSGNPELVSLFLEFGAHVDAVNREGSSVAEVVGHNNTAIIQQSCTEEC